MANGSESASKAAPVEKAALAIPFKARVTGWVAAQLLRLVGLTLRLEVEDSEGLLESPPETPLIWAFWHNRIFVVPGFWHRRLPSRRGAVLTSASRDGAVLAAAMEALGASAVRGSSSRRGAKAMMELRAWIEKGFDVAITPDGPRGPRYQLAPGLIRLASVTGAPILCLRVRYENCWTLRSWDQFRIPKPFSKVVVEILPLQRISKGVDGESFQGERARIEALLGGDD